MRRLFPAVAGAILLVSACHPTSTEPRLELPDRSTESSAKPAGPAPLFSESTVPTDSGGAQLGGHGMGSGN